MKLGLRILGGALAGMAVAGLISAAAAASITGAGATFPAPIYLKWAATYKGVSGTSINYSSIGSGGGIAQIKAKTVTFGATDAPLKANDLDAFGLVQFPTVIGGVVPIINLSGVKAGALVLDSSTLAKIFLGEIARWNDPAIAALNPGVKLPSQAIAVVHRSDGSGTTFIWANYLSKVSATWADRVGFATAVDWPVGIGARGNEGVAQNVAQTSGAIGYVEYAYALVNNLTTTRVINKAGMAVSPNLESFAAAAEGVDWNVPGFYVVLTDAAGKDSWPIAGATFILVHKNPPDLAATTAALKFFQWAFDKGDEMAKSLDYDPLPDAVVQKVLQSWSQVQGWGG
jgi:phosphate transport system substrate-binding protein